MHCHAEVWIPKRSFVERRVVAAMKPYDENNHDDGWWDWYQLGGRYTGSHSNYNPEDDQRNVEVCNLCDGTGFRRDNIGNNQREQMPSYTCNGCGEFDEATGEWKHSRYGPGYRLKWPTQWVAVDDTVMPVSEIKDNLECHTLIVNNEVVHIETWNNESKHWETTNFNGAVKPILESMGITDGFLVTVDYHD